MSLSISFLDGTLIYSKTKPKHQGLTLYSAASWSQRSGRQRGHGMPGHTAQKAQGSASCLRCSLCPASSSPCSPCSRAPPPLSPPWGCRSWQLGLPRREMLIGPAEVRGQPWVQQRTPVRPCGEGSPGGGGGGLGGARLRSQGPPQAASGDLFVSRATVSSPRKEMLDRRVALRVK